MPARQFTRIQELRNRPEYAGRDPFGRLGLGAVQSPGSITDPYYAAQIEQSVGEEGRPLGTSYRVDNQGRSFGGSYVDRQGRRVRQLGDGANGGYGAAAAGDVIDPDGIRYDDDLGWVTDFDNFKEDPDDLGGFGTLVRTVIAAGGAYAAGGAAGLWGAPVEGAALAGSNPFAGGLLEGSVSYGGAGAGLGAGAANPFAGGVLEGGVSYGPAAASSPWGMLAPGMENSALADSWLINQGPLGARLAATGITNLLSSGGLSRIGSGLLSSAVSNPSSLLGLYQIGSGLLDRGGGKPSGGPGGGPGGSGPGKGGDGGVPATRTPFQRNPFTQQQIANYNPIQPRDYRS